MTDLNENVNNVNNHDNQLGRNKNVNDRMNDVEKRRQKCGRKDQDERPSRAYQPSSIGKESVHRNDLIGGRKT